MDCCRRWLSRGHDTVALSIYGKERDVAKAIEYVLLGQGDELFKLDD